MSRFRLASDTDFFSFLWHHYVSGHSHPNSNSLSPNKCKVRSWVSEESGCRTLAATFSSEIVVWELVCESRSGVWVQRGTLLGRMDFLRFSVVPQIEFFPFVVRGKKKKAIMLENCSLEALGLLLTNAKGSEEKWFVISMRKKNPIFLCELEVMRSPFKFQYNVRRAFRNGGWFDLFLKVYWQKQTAVYWQKPEDFNFLFMPSQKLSLV